MNDSNEQAQERYFQAAASWDADSRNAERLSLKRYKALGIGAVVFAAIMGVYASTSLRAAKDLAALLARGAIVSTVVTTVLLPAVLLMAHKVLAKTSAGWPEGTREGSR